MRPVVTLLCAWLVWSGASAAQRRGSPFVPVGVVHTGDTAELLSVRNRGFNTITIVARWSDVEPARGEYRFDAIERTIDRAASTGLRVVLALDASASPAWLLERYPDGRLASDVEQPRSTQGCLDHPGVREDFLKLVSTASVRASRHPGWFVLDVGSVPQAGFCSCPHTRRRFEEWSASTRDSDRAAFVSFARREDLRQMVDASAARGNRLVVSHARVASILQRPRRVWPSQDDWMMSPLVDLYGGLVPSEQPALAFDSLSSATRTNGWSMSADASVPASDARMLGWAAIARGARALTFTNWREAPLFAGVITRNPALFDELRPRPAKVAIVYDPRRDTASLIALHRALFDRNIPVVFLHADEVASQAGAYPLVLTVSDRDVAVQVTDALNAFAASGLKPDVRIDTAQGQVETRFLESSNVLLLIGINHADTSQRVTMTFTPDTQEAIWQNMETGAGVNFIAGPEGPTYSYWFRPHDALVLLIRKDLR
jgi:hypothetical protein